MLSIIKPLLVSMILFSFSPLSFSKDEYQQGNPTFIPIISNGVTFFIPIIDSPKVLGFHESSDYTYVYEGSWEATNNAIDYQIKIVTNSGQTIFIRTEQTSIVLDQLPLGAGSVYLSACLNSTQCGIESKVFAYSIPERLTFIITDQFNSPILQAGMTGNQKQEFKYSAYGKGQDASTDTEIGFTGHKLDMESGLLYSGNRLYNPDIGRFYSQDKINARDIHSVNRYAYANNNPYKYVDPDGNLARLVKTAWNIAKRTYQNGGDLKKASKEEWQSFAENAAELLDGDFTADDIFAAADLLTGFGSELKKAAKDVELGVIYKVEGKHPITGEQQTSSGLDYIGRSDHMLDRALNANDGRDRNYADVEALYDTSIPNIEKRILEQESIENSGGITELDNKRNEISNKKYNQYKQGISSSIGFGN